MVQIDNAGRVLLPKKINGLCGPFRGEAVVSAYGSKIEIWGQKRPLCLNWKLMQMTSPWLRREAAGCLITIKGTITMSSYHQPVMLSQCIEALNIKTQWNLCRCDLRGAVGHSKEILARLGKQGKLYAF